MHNVVARAKPEEDTLDEPDLLRSAPHKVALPGGNDKAEQLALALFGGSCWPAFQQMLDGVLVLRAL